METIRLFDRDSFIKDFMATVISCVKVENGETTESEKKAGEQYKIILDQTAFFPEGGGQTADTGYLLILADKNNPESTILMDGEVVDVQEWVAEDDLQVPAGQREELLNKM